MTIETSQIFESYVPVFDTMPDDWEQGKVSMVEHLKKISNGVNAREIGFYLDEEVLSGKQFAPTGTLSGTSEQFRSGFRMVVDFGSLPNNTSKSVAHNIVVDVNFTLVEMYAAATDPIGLTALPIPYASNSAGDPISLSMDNTNVIITTGKDRRNYTRCFVVIEYLQEI